MMTPTRLFLTLVLVVVTTTLAGTAAAGSCTRNRCTAQINRLYLDRAQLYVAMDADQKRLSCSQISDVYLKLPGSHEMFSELHAMLLGAFLGGRKVTVRTADSGDCNISYVLMDR